MICKAKNCLKNIPVVILYINPQGWSVVVATWMTDILFVVNFLDKNQFKIT